MNRTNKLLERRYHIPLAMFDDAFVRFQKKYVYPQNFLLTAVLAAIACVYVHAVVKDNTQTLAYLLIVICLALILVRWYKTFRLRRAVHDALKDVENDTYTLTLYDTGIVIRTEDAPAAETVSPAAAEEASAENASPEAEKPEGNGFAQLFPEEIAAANEPIPPTEIEFGSGVRTHDCGEYFMVYVVKQNFYVIPKKDFSESEILQLSEAFSKS